MKRKLFLLLCFSITCTLLLRAALDPKKEYIERYSQIAISEMSRSGVPASITLAQGILESASGQSELAMKANNHFGIKCHSDWKGSSIYYDDDKKGECFRVYERAEESFRDHSDFLRYRDRYKFLFEYDPCDYKAWANGLKTAGYATDPSYASKLIDIIESYELFRYDSIGEDEKGLLPEAPALIEEPEVIYKAEGREEYRFSLSRQLMSKNGVPFVYSVDGETYSSIARQFNLFVWEILSFNDLDKECELQPGTVVYVGRKKDRTQKGLDKYVVESDGEQLWDVCQRFAVKEKTVRKRNHLPKKGVVVLREGDTILLR